ncbi:hypothetical protein B0H11DRAFT_2284788 [Mycena galericulata]|nr:hypothetical protein B0H11DRAFT_2284788 [Mycena galericulata]
MNTLVHPHRVAKAHHTQIHWNPNSKHQQSSKAYRYNHMMAQWMTTQLISHRLPVVKTTVTVPTLRPLSKIGTNSAILARRSEAIAKGATAIGKGFLLRAQRASRTLKTKYKDYRTLLGSTGQGVVENDKTKDIEPGSNIENIWDLIKAKFPWYLRMHALMGSSPAVDRSALAHSQTRVDLSVLDGRGKKVVPIDSDDDSASDAESDKISNWDKNDGPLSISSSSPPPDHSLPIPQTPVQVKPEPTHASVGRSGPHGTKRKSIQEHVEEIATADRAQRTKVAEIREHGKTVRAKGKFEAKSELELAKMRHQATEAERQRQHEIAMMDRQMELERIRQAGPAAFGPPQVPGGPAYGAPPPQSAYDPSLFR